MRGFRMTMRTALAASLCLTAPLASAPVEARNDNAAPAGTNLGTGMASYYAHDFAGRRTASGEPYRSSGFTAAHRSAPFGSRIRVRNLGNGREVVVRVNDRGPWSGGRIIDLSWAAAKAIGLNRSGTAKVSLTLLGK